MNQRPIDIVRACLKAYADHDRAALEALVAADYTFTSPMDNALNREAYFWWDLPHKVKKGEHSGRPA